MIAFYIIGFLIIIYLCVAVIFGPTCPKNKFLSCVGWNLGNLSGRFYLLLVIALVLMFIGSP